MEDQIAEAPEEFLGEPGLSLVKRQAHFGRYIFDLLFEDRHGGKLIVEIQKGTLDRNHTYKILDYYDEYKERNPGEFVDIMVVANVIPAERKKRLRALGVSFKEIPESEFLSDAATLHDAASLTEQATITEVQNAPQRHEKEEVTITDISEYAKTYWDDKDRRCYIGFQGHRATIAFLYARQKGASHKEVGNFAASLGTKQRKYWRMLNDEARQWGHSVYTWRDKSRGGKVFKLVYNPDHRCPYDCDPRPDDWEEKNKIDAPVGVDPEKWF